MNLDEIRRYWEDAAGRFADGKVTPTSRDPFLAELETANVLAHLRPEMSVLEVGCGDGAHTVRYASLVRRLVGVDVAAGMVARARRRAEEAGLANATFVVGSALDLGASVGGGAFDAVVSQRCLINLAEWAYQEQAISQIHHVLRPGGLLLLSEAFQGELDALNEVRTALGLTPIEVVPFNRNLDRHRLEGFVAERFEIVDRRDYGAYLFLSRVLHPLAVLPAEPAHDSALNDAAMRVARAVPMPDLARFSYNLFYALRKR